MITDNFQQLSNFKKYFSILAVLNIHWGTQALNRTGSVVSAAHSYQESAWNAGDTGDKGLIPEWERSPGGGNGNPLEYSCLKNPKDRGVWGLQSMGSRELDTTERLSTAHVGS